ncbi:MAG: 4Fe-4S dicluster domain-containing protein, partial [Lachnospiraceae bacterium]|nr:4Fe-4S dicluster domain-containing protein [Lachnospiraceae bacterium]
VFESAPWKRTPAEWGLRWLWNHKQVTVVLSGMNDISQVEENCRVASESLPGHLSKDERRIYGRVVHAITRSVRVGCTGCGYCQPCPRGVDIPTCFAAYNTTFSDSMFTGMKEYVMCTTMRSGRSNAGLCVKCGLCETKCPQHIHIRDELENVRRRMENPVYMVAAAVMPKMFKY